MDTLPPRLKGPYEASSALGCTASPASGPKRYSLRSSPAHGSITPAVPAYAAAGWNSTGTYVADADGVMDGVGLLDGVPDGVGLFDGVPDGVGLFDGVPDGVEVIDGVGTGVAGTADAASTRTPKQPGTADVLAVHVSADSARGGVKYTSPAPAL
jgi:hypothetical protein